ncbi:hypothetical protein [Tsukamurella tyrosinosolvens]|uniref:hypothetical protein n=1 Tax=Tsukamurella tyrosinosolvens TaxID=57704 RepID=UPI0011C02BEF|nr:hypothetical protein [Tsukamurella tyrosinosolvens]
MGAVAHDDAAGEGGFSESVEREDECGGSADEASGVPGERVKGDDLPGLLVSADRSSDDRGVAADRPREQTRELSGRGAPLGHALDRGHAAAAAADEALPRRLQERHVEADAALLRIALPLPAHVVSVDQDPGVQTLRSAARAREVFEVVALTLSHGRLEHGGLGLLDRVLAAHRLDGQFAGVETESNSVVVGGRLGVSPRQNGGHAASSVRW